MADQSNAVMVVGVAQGETMREYRKGNWTLHEALVLITAKKLDEERRMKKESGGEGRGGRPTELRWKWVEDYCWKNGCMRSQNQCNDKWDNLMRDYKKVRDHEKKVEDGREQSSYWKLERHERKDKNLPTNLLPQIHEALVEVVERRGTQRARVHVHTNSIEVGLVGEKPISSSMPLSLPLSHHHSSLPTPPQPPSPHAQALATLDSDGSEHSNSSAKRRRKRGEGSSSPGAAHELSSAISKSASILSEALLACEEKEERRHRELINVEERKLKIEESKTDISRQAINGLTAAVNKLATSILDLASERKNPSAPG